MLEKMYPEAVFVTVINTAENAHDNSSTLVDKIRKRILLFFDERMKTVTIRLNYQHSQHLANIYEWSRVDNIDYQEEGIMMTLTTIPGNLERLRHHLGSGFTEMS
jgi:50S ribosomal subunit-associated GTPase HflX